MQCLYRRIRDTHWCASPIRGASWGCRTWASCRRAASWVSRLRSSCFIIIYPLALALSLSFTTLRETRRRRRPRSGAIIITRSAKRKMRKRDSDGGGRLYYCCCYRARINVRDEFSRTGNLGVAREQRAVVVGRVAAVASGRRASAAKQINRPSPSRNGGGISDESEAGYKLAHHMVRGSAWEDGNRGCHAGAAGCPACRGLEHCFRGF